MDGASRGNPGHAGGGGVFRDYHGKWIGGFSCNLNWCSSMKAELLALLKGLRLAWEGRFSRLEVNMDSQVVVNLIQGPCMINQAFHFVIKECQDLLFNRPWEASFKHCYREANRVADYLANLGVGQSPCVSFLTPLLRSWLSFN